MSKICCFAGHSQLYNEEEIYPRLITAIEDAILTENITEFWAGNYGAFDKLSAKAVRDLKEKYPFIRLCLVIPYLTTEINRDKDRYRSSYDEIIIADIPQNTPRNIKIILSNRYVVNNSAMLICYAKHPFGGTAKTLEYAKKGRHIKIINICEHP